MTELTPAQENARDRIHDLLAELTDLFGPAGLDDDEWEPGEAPVGQALLSEWVVVAAWVDERGQSYPTGITSRHLPAHHRSGLLHEALFGLSE